LYYIRKNKAIKNAAISEKIKTKNYMSIPAFLFAA